MKFACIQKYYDNGKATYQIKETEYNPPSDFEKHKDYDLYIDYFDSPKEAQDFGKEVTLA